MFSFYNIIFFQKGKIEKVTEEDTYNDDDYFDRTLEKKIKKDNDQTEATTANLASQKIHDFQSLKAHLEELLKTQEQLNLSILDFNNKKNEEQQEEDDALELYMQANQDALNLQQRQKLLHELEIVNNEIEE